MLNLNLRETRNSFRHLNLSWISNKTIMRVGNITKAATFESFLHVSLTACFNELKEVKYFKKIKKLKSLPVKADAYLEPNRASMMKIFFCGNIVKKLLFSLKKTPSQMLDWIL